MAIVIRMPAVLASATEAAIQAWSVTEGQTIEVGDPLADIETDKAVVEYAAEVAGTVGRLIAQPGTISPSASRSRSSWARVKAWRRSRPPSPPQESPTRPRLLPRGSLRLPPL
jgi:Pyruvate/2-oxoglutarate dehydrogenase complex, dihydrolipoamide acyltransferase (E2) component, and related enzymes